MNGMPISSLANALTLAVNRPVIDRTGLTGRFDFEMEFTPVAAGTAADDPDRVSIFTALREQLGLRLQAEDVGLEVLVIDNVERPSQN